MNYLITDKLGYSRQDTLRNEFIFHKNFSDRYDSHHRKMAHKTIIIIVLWIRGYSDAHRSASPLFVDHLTVVQRYLRPHCHLLRTTKLLEQPYFHVALSMGKHGNQNTSVSSSNRDAASHFPCIPFCTCYNSFRAARYMPTIRLSRHYYSQLFTNIYSLQISTIILGAQSLEGDVP